MLKQRSYIVIEGRLCINYLFLFRTLFIFFHVNEHLAVPFVELARGGPLVGHLHSVSFVCMGLLVWAFIQSHKLNLTYCSKSSLLLAFSSVCLVDQCQMYPSFISPLQMLHCIICNIQCERPPLFIGGWDFWKLISCKNGGYLIYGGCL